MNEKELNRNRLSKEYIWMKSEEYEDLKEQILSYFDSEEMKSYLRDNFHRLSDSTLIEIIVGAQRPIKQKCELLTELAKRFPYHNSTSDEERFKDLYDYSLYAKQYQDYRTDMFSGGEQAIYLVRGYEDDSEYDLTPQFTFDAALTYIKESSDRLRDEYTPEDFMWFEIEKWINRDGNSMMKSKYTLSANGEIWDYRYCSKEQTLLHQFGYRSASGFYLPVPFNIGDIVTIDCRPSAPISHTVILDIGDNCDCCSVQGLYVNVDGEVKFGALKHANAQDFSTYQPLVSPLYKAETFHGDLPPEEKFMTEFRTELIKWYLHDPDKYEEEWLETIDNFIKPQCTPQELIEKIKKHIENLK